ncbi:MAG TPA: VWA domain-containing protein [Puia sp.]|nr:VWA domain-containing protein [Puia sp.]
MFRFQHIEYFAGLLAIPLLILLFLWVLRWKKKTAGKMGDPGLIQQLIKNYSPLLFTLKFGIALLAITVIITGASNLQKKGSAETINRTGVDVMIVLDVSKSMLAEDIQPSRLGKAKQLLLRLLDNLENDRVGLILFAGRAYMQMPLTIDQGAAKMYIQNAGPDVVPTQGTVIADALQMANSAFNSKEHKYKAIVLVSDGEDHDPDAMKVAKQLADDGVMINTIGIGTPDGSVIIDPVTHETKKDENGQIVISKLNEQELSQIADATNGIYIRLDNMDDAVITLSQRLNSIEKRALTDTDFVNYKNYFQWFLAAALLLLIIEFILPERKLKLS